MNKLVSDGMWNLIVSEANKAKKRRLAIAYVTSSLSIRFRKGDVLICDASEKAALSGQTSANALMGIQSQGAEILSIENLHAKILLFDHCVVCGSGNLSTNSQMNLVEAAIITDDDDIISGAAIFFEALYREGKKMTQKDLQALPPPIKRPANGPKTSTRVKAPKLGEYKSWIIHVKDEDLKTEAEERTRDMGIEEAERLSRTDVEYVRFSNGQAFARNARLGDRITILWKDDGKNVSRVYASTPIVHIKKDAKSVWFFHAEHSKRNSVSWNAFRKLCEKVQMDYAPKPNSMKCLSKADTEKLSRGWRFMR